ncbi:MAG: hypothetical protein KAW56_03415 [Candidatus Marinimicrobia bacterium]|nr:hypothetical protein [Candidatus Neomarinimicrobiota bacterium]
MKDIDNKIDFFFENPNIWIEGRKRFSNLYLLRRDIIQCFGFDPSSGNKIGYRVLWPGAMSLLAGIDLLSKYYYGQDEFGKVGERFKGYIKKYININKDEAEIIYQLRNSLLHSFGLYSYKLDKITKKRIEFSFMLKATGDKFVSRITENKYLIDILTLWREFEKSIPLYCCDLRNNDELKKNFYKMFPYYSITDIG